MHRWGGDPAPTCSESNRRRSDAAAEAAANGAPRPRITRSLLAAPLFERSDPHGVGGCCFGISAEYALNLKLPVLGADTEMDTGDTRRLCIDSTKFAGVAWGDIVNRFRYLSSPSPSRERLQRSAIRA